MDAKDKLIEIIDILDRLPYYEDSFIQIEVGYPNNYFAFNIDRNGDGTWDLSDITGNCRDSLYLSSIDIETLKFRVSFWNTIRSIYLTYNGNEFNIYENYPITNKRIHYMQDVISAKRARRQ